MTTTMTITIIMTVALVIITTDINIQIKHMSHAPTFCLTIKTIYINPSINDIALTT